MLVQFIRWMIISRLLSNAQQNFVYLENDELFPLMQGIGKEHMENLNQSKKEIIQESTYQNSIFLYNISIQNSQQIIQMKKNDYESKSIIYYLIQTSHDTQTIQSYQIEFTPFHYYQEKSNLSLISNPNIEYKMIKEYDNQKYCWDMLKMNNDIYILGYKNSTKELFLEVITDDNNSSFFKYKKEQQQGLHSTQAEIIQDSLIFAIGNQICILVGHKSQNYTLNQVIFVDNEFYLALIFSQKQFSREIELILNNFLYQKEQLYLYGGHDYIIIGRNLTVQKGYNEMKFDSIFPRESSTIQMLYFQKDESKYNNLQLQKQDNISILFYQKYLSGEYDLILHNQEYLYISGQEKIIKIDFISFIEKQKLLLITKDQVLQIYQIICQTNNFIQIRDKTSQSMENFKLYNLNLSDSIFHYNLTISVPFNSSIQQEIIKIKNLPTITIQYIKNKNNIVSDVMQRTQIQTLQFEIDYQNSKLIYVNEFQQYILIAYFSNVYYQNEQISGFFLYYYGFSNQVQSLLLYKIENIDFNLVKLFYQIENQLIFIAIQMNQQTKFIKVTINQQLISFDYINLNDFEIIKYDFKLDILFIKDSDYLYISEQLFSQKFIKQRILTQILNYQIVALNQKQLVFAQFENSNNTICIINKTQIKLRLQITSYIEIKFLSRISNFQVIEFDNNYLAIVVQCSNNLLIYHYYINESNQYILIKQVIISTYQIEQFMVVKRFNSAFIIEAKFLITEIKKIFVFNLDYPSNYCLRIVYEKVSPQYLLSQEGNLIFRFFNKLLIIHHKQILIQFKYQKQNILHSFTEILHLQSPYNKLINNSQLNLSIRVQTQSTLQIIQKEIKIKRIKGLQYQLNLKGSYIGLLQNVMSDDFEIQSPLTLNNRVLIGSMQNIIFLKNKRILQIDFKLQMASIKYLQFNGKEYTFNLIESLQFQLPICKIFTILKIKDMDFFIMVCSYETSSQQMPKIELVIYRLIYSTDVKESIKFEQMIAIPEFSFLDLKHNFINKNQMILQFEQQYLIYTFFYPNDSLYFKKDIIKIDNVTMNQQGDELLVYSINKNEFTINVLKDLEFISIFNNTLLNNYSPSNIQLLYQDKEKYIFSTQHDHEVLILFFINNNLMNKITVKNIENSQIVDFQIINENIFYIYMLDIVMRQNKLLLYSLDITKNVGQNDYIIYPIQIVELEGLQNRKLTIQHIEGDNYIIYAKHSQFLSCVQIRPTYLIQLKNTKQQDGIIHLQSDIQESSFRDIAIFIIEEEIKITKLQTYIILTIASLIIEIIFIHCKHGSHPQKTNNNTNLQ